MYAFTKQLESRLIDFSVSIVIFYEKLPNNKSCQHLGHQLMRSGTSPSLNYGEACMAESRKDFIHKMKICLKELKETANCLQILQKSSLLKVENTSEEILKECNELIAIFVQSVKTAKSNR